MEFRLSCAALAALGLAAGAPAAQAAADLTIDYGSKAAPYSASGLYQIVEAGNRFGDTPRTVVDDEGGSLSGSGSAAPITSNDFEIDLNFQTLTESVFSAELEPLTSDPIVGLDLYKGSTLVASLSSTPAGLLILATDIEPGAYTLRLTGEVLNPADPTNLEAEGLFQFSGQPATAVPEPATWAMMLVGFGGLGAVLRRRVRAIA
jgi:hypothetical protein